MAYFFLALAIALEILGLTALKACHGFTRLLPTVIFVLGIGASFYFESLALKVLPIGMTYAVWAGVGIVGMFFVGSAFYGEEINLGTLAGILLIVAGVSLVLNAAVVTEVAASDVPGEPGDAQGQSARP